MNSYNRILLFAVLLISQFGFSQDYNQQQKKLEAQKLSIQNEIKKINILVSENKKKTKSLLDNIEDVELKISVRNKLIDVNNKQSTNLSNQIKNKSDRIYDLQIDLKKLKDEYATIVSNSYKNRSSKVKLMFLFASRDFNQAFSRFQYFKQYSAFRKEQAKTIILTQENIKLLIDTLENDRKKRQLVIDENKKIKIELEGEKLEKNRLFNNLEKTNKNYLADIRRKEIESKLIDNEIEKLIRLAISASNNNDSSVNNFALTPEGRIISSNFLSNKGQLPWPLKEGVITRRFGTQPHPVVRTTTINSTGIMIATSPNSVVSSIFEGQVLSVYGFKGGNPGILIRHGKYISNYQNLSQVFVKKGDKIKAGEEIGIIFTNNTSGKAVLKFSIFNEVKPENPQNWLSKF
ncbi:MAG: peptidoglycan DD-metalloendopeptidase family protein [Bacteroidota bacterium]|nr:peptidoglycan DD-metalloendopeptidase family protein [Bacteroidota bacterium]